MNSDTEAAIRAVVARVPAPSASAAVIVGVAGGVAAGKTTTAYSLASMLESEPPGSRRVEVLGTDAFLFSNAELERRGLTARKGFPETYDVARLRAAVAAVRAHEGVVVPIYSHDVYDVIPDDARRLEPVDVLVVEGLHVIAQLHGLLDLSVYLEASDDLLESWYVSRFHELRAAARDRPWSFYAPLADMEHDQADSMARAVWRAVNLPNLREHVRPARDAADIVVVKGSDHRIVEVREHAPMTADGELVEQLDQVWTSMSDLGGQLTEEEWKRATEVPGWSVQDNLVHIAAIEASLLGREAPDHEIPDDLAHVKNDMGRRNEVFVDSRRACSGADALAEFREVTRERLEQLRSCDEGAFSAESWTPVGPGTVRDLLPFRVFDSWVHEQDMRRAVGYPGDLDTPVAAVALERMVSSMPFVVGKKAAAPEGATVVFELFGPLARTVAISVKGGRARDLDPVPESATVRLVMDTETFGRLATGRVDPAAEVAGGRVRVEGDDELARRIVESMNFLF